VLGWHRRIAGADRRRAAAALSTIEDRRFGGGAGRPSLTAARRGKLAHTAIEVTQPLPSAVITTRPKNRGWEEPR